MNTGRVNDGDSKVWIELATERWLTANVRAKTGWATKGRQDLGVSLDKGLDRLLVPRIVDGSFQVHQDTWLKRTSNTMGLEVCDLLLRGHVISSAS